MLFLQEREALEEKMKALEEDKNRMFKKEEEKEELKGLATQELAKVKHMVSVTQEISFSSLEKAC